LNTVEFLVIGVYENSEVSIKVENLKVDMPKGLYYHSAVYHKNKIIVFGGTNSSFKLVNEVIIYDIVVNKWYKPKVSGD
jgi:hypothetical protein